MYDFLQELMPFLSVLFFHFVHTIFQLASYKYIGNLHFISETEAFIADKCITTS